MENTSQSKKKMEKLLRAADIVRRGKKPIEAGIYFPTILDADGRSYYSFNGKKWTFEELQKELEKYECLDKQNVILWYEEKTYPEEIEMIKDGTLQYGEH